MGSELHYLGRCLIDSYDTFLWGTIAMKTEGKSVKKQKIYFRLQVSVRGLFYLQFLNNSCIIAYDECIACKVLHT